MVHDHLRKYSWVKHIVWIKEDTGSLSSQYNYSSLKKNKITTRCKEVMDKFSEWLSS